MTNHDILHKLEAVIADVFGRPVALSRATTAKDVPGWDSLRQLLIIAGAEEAFGVQFSSAEMDSLRSVGDFADLIHRKLAAPNPQST